ncbi:MAG: EamA family transporter [Candidatus Dadabacteria bacterium]|nr:EamA family transporter [Candidatus Dadabacteria bacterium]NIT13791.1 EamA family transporter [Candidatus Dadabacteria bacterium]
MTASLLALLVAFIWGINPIMEKLSLIKATPLSVMTVRFIMTSIVLVAISLYNDKFDEISNLDTRTYYYIIIPAILAGVGLYIYFTALGKGESSRVVPIVATFPLFTAIYAFLILKESITTPKLIGTFLIVAGLVILNWNSVAKT